MPAVLLWFASFFLKEVVKETFKKASMIVMMNIAMGFIINWLQNHSMEGLTFLGVGGSVTAAIQSLGPMVGFWWNLFNMSFAVFLILNAILFRFVFDLHLSALGASR